MKTQAKRQSKQQLWYLIRAQIQTLAWGKWPFQFVCMRKVAVVVRWRNQKWVFVLINVCGINVQLALWVKIYPLSNIGFLSSNTPQIDKENVAAQTRINDWCCVSIPKSVRRSRRECVMWNLKSALSKIEKDSSVFPIHVCEIRGSLFHSFRVT